MKIRKAINEDVDELVKLYILYNKDLEKITPKRNQYFNKKKVTYNFEIKKSITKTLKDKSSIILIVEENGKLVGTVSGWVTEIKSDLFNDTTKFGYLQYLFVLPKYRNKGLSSKLKNKLFDWFKEKGCNFIRLDVASTNPAIKAYEKWGFEVDSLKMIKQLKRKSKK